MITFAWVEWSMNRRDRNTLLLVRPHYHILNKYRQTWCQLEPIRGERTAETSTSHLATVGELGRCRGDDRDPSKLNLL